MTSPAPARLVTRSDLPAVCRALAQAFVDDPMVAWLVADDDPARRIEKSIAGFFEPATVAGLHRGHSYTVGTPRGDQDAASIWAPPDVEMLTEEEGGALAGRLAEACGGDAVARLLQLGELVNRHHPHDTPHFYLLILGAATQGRGAGSAALQPVLERCDADGLPAYLESSSARNLSFYERHGFRVQWEEAPGEGGPMMRGMWREPGSGRG